MKNKTNHPAVSALRIRALVLWVLSGVFIVLIIGSICFYRNPWVTHTLDAAQVSAEDLEAIGAGHSPYVKIEGIDLTFTGYYKVDDTGAVTAYCFTGDIADTAIFAELSADELGDLVSTDEEAPVLTDYTLSGQLIDGSEMILMIAQTEGVEVEKYLEKNGLTALTVHAHGKDQERMRIIQLILLILAIGSLAAGWIHWSESGVVARELAAEGTDADLSGEE